VSGDASMVTTLALRSAALVPIPLRSRCACIAVYLSKLPTEPGCWLHQCGAASCQLELAT
jgi:hypothetical protein